MLAAESNDEFVFLHAMTQHMDMLDLAIRWRVSFMPRLLDPRGNTIE
jgi:hypothetical protein